MDGKLSALLKAVLSKTDAGQVEWNAMDSQTFRARIGEGSLHLTQGWSELPGKDGDFRTVETIYVSITDNIGRVVSEIESAKGGEDHLFLEQLLQSVRKHAFRSDRVLDEMLQSLLGAAK